MGRGGRGGERWEEGAGLAGGVEVAETESWGGGATQVHGEGAQDCECEVEPQADPAASLRIGDCEGEEGQTDLLLQILNRPSLLNLLSVLKLLASSSLFACVCSFCLVGVSHLLYMRTCDLCK